MKKLISSILMVAGTTIGGGMIILPAVVGSFGYYAGALMLILVWLINVIIALTFLESNFYLPVNASFISISDKLLGKYGRVLAWIICLLFLYTIMSAYASGVREIATSFIGDNGLCYLPIGASIITTLVLSVFIFMGTNHVSSFNKLIVMTMFVTFAIIIYVLGMQTHIDFITQSHNQFPIRALPITFTAFGFLIIIPSLRSYLDSNIKHLKVSLIIGSLIPLIIYLLWLTVTMGVISSNDLSVILKGNEPVKLLTNTLMLNSNQPNLAVLIQLFVLFAILSSFVGTSLGLYDFLSDGLKIEKTSAGKLKLLIFTFIPPLIIAFSFSSVFLAALGFASILSTVLFAIYPVLMVWSARYVKKLETIYRLSINKLILFLLLMYGAVIIVVELAQFGMN